MPWKESRVVDERLKFIAEVLKGEESITVLCLRFGISRKTGYKWRALRLGWPCITRSSGCGLGSLTRESSRANRRKTVATSGYIEP
jgi:hypothetical protein